VREFRERVCDGSRPLSQALKRESGREEEEEAWIIRKVPELRAIEKCRDSERGCGLNYRIEIGK
jgi:hypothetical protein